MGERHLADERGRRERQRLIERYLPLARGAARRFVGRGERLDDLVQVACLAVVKAVDRRDRTRPETLTAYVARCVDGELRRHLRDSCATVRVPRSALDGEAEAASVATARAPLAIEDTALARAADDEEPHDVAVTRALVAAGAGSLDRRERRVLLLRYFVGLSQAEVGRAEGVSQVQVCRLQQRALEKMRATLGAGATAGSAP
jgi:RNA polymerase sigma-B factor